MAPGFVHGPANPLLVKVLRARLRCDEGSADVSRHSPHAVMSLALAVSRLPCRPRQPHRENAVSVFALTIIRSGFTWLSRGINSQYW